MKNLKTQELQEINGGIGSSLLGAIMIGAVILVSAVYGFFHPYKCGRD